MLNRLRELEPTELTTFTNDLKAEILELVTDKIPHLEASMAVAELTVALHYLLRTPQDILIWDVGHQGYIHKALTGRLDELKNQRKKGGISGFLKREESEYDFFGAGHASTSISALAGVCIADKVAGRARRRVAVIGDGALTGGQSFEALNHLSMIQTDCLVILNDNNGSIDPTIGALHNKKGYQEYFNSLGWSYSMLEKGNDITAIMAYLQSALARGGKRVLHLKTKRPSLQEEKSYEPGTTFQWWAAEQMHEIVRKYPDMRVFSPAMFASSGFGPLSENLPHQFIDTGINEPHAVTVAAAMLAAGGRAWVHIYSTFMQRAIDQIIHDVALQKLPLVFLVDRAGIVGADGPTHHGTFDLGFLMDVPNVTIWNPRNGDELQVMMRRAAEDQFRLSGPLFIRYPKDRTVCNSPENLQTLRWLHNQGAQELIISTGVLSSKITPENSDHLHLGQVKPLPEELADHLSGYERIVVVEEGQGAGGLFGAIAHHMSSQNTKATLVSKKIGDAFVDHGERDDLLKELGLIP